MKKRTIAFDLDATICNSIRRFHPEDILKVKPYPKMIEIMKKLKARGHTVIIFTRRGCLKQGRILTKKWIKLHNIPCDKLITSKPSYDLLICDRTMSPFEGWISTGTIESQIELIYEQMKKKTYKFRKRK